MEFAKELKYLNNNRAKVCIIGAGAGGLCAIRTFLKHADNFEIEVFEKTNSVGGTWVYNEKTDKDNYGQPIHSSMYANLRTNIPLHVMEFLDFASKKNRQSFVSHQEVLDYLEDYAKDSDAYKYIKFHHVIKEVKRIANCWSVQVENLETKENFTRDYDVVLVCVGRYSKPKIPESCDLSKFKGRVLHSHHYRRPENFANENVLILGAGPSGLDISLELVDQAKKIYLLHKLKSNFLDLPAAIEQVNDSIKCAVEKKVITNDGLQFDDIDTIMFATGYDYDFDFLDENVGIKLQSNGKLENIYLHLVNSLYPTMCFLAIPQRLLPFPMYYQQLQWYLGYLLGKFELPSKEEMDRFEDEDYAKRIADGFQPRHSHKLITEDHLWDYEKLICEQSRSPRICDARRKCFNSLHMLRREYATSYKDWKYFELSDTEFKLNSNP